MPSPAMEALCRHCGTPVPPHAADPQFCCMGCAHVYQLLKSAGLGRFYELRGSQALAPVPPESLRRRDEEWLVELVQLAESAAGDRGAAHLRLAVQGLSCVACIWLVERMFQRQPGALRVDVHAARGEMQVTWQPGVFDVVAFSRQLQACGYLTGKPDDAVSAGVQSVSFGRRVALCGAFAMNAMAFSLPAYLGMREDFMFATWFDIIAACSATLALLAGGSYFAERSLQALRHGVLHMDTPVTLGIAAAWAGSMAGWLGGVPGLKYFDFVAVFIFLMLLGRWTQQSAVERNRRRLLQTGAIPETVLKVISGGEVEKLPLGRIARGDLLRIRPGGICPVGGVLHSPAASLSLAWINGESRATPRLAGQAVPSGATNIGARPLEMVAGESWADSLLCRLGQSRMSGQNGQAASGGLLRWYLATVVVLGLGGAFCWWWAGQGAAAALQVMISVFVVSCPCAIGVAVPFADDLAATRMERHGLFIRAHDLWARLVRVKKVVFDKTGTLTLENPVLVNPGALESLDARARAALRSLVSQNLHPVSRALFDMSAPLPHGNLAPPEDDAVPEEVVGQGLWQRDGSGRVWSLGRPGWRGPGGPRETAGTTNLEQDAEFACDGVVLASFTFSDALRPETLAACQALRRAGQDLHLLSGDRAAKVRTIAELLEIPEDRWQAEMTPGQKASRVTQLNDHDTLFVGDGANDSLAIEASLCAGSPVTGRHFLEHKADFYFLGASLKAVPVLLAVARVRRRAVRRVAAFALTYNAAAVVLSLAGQMSPLLAAVLMPLSSLVTLGLVRLSFGGENAARPASLDAASLAQRMRGQGAPVPI